MCSYVTIANVAYAEVFRPFRLVSFCSTKTEEDKKPFSDAEGAKMKGDWDATCASERHVSRIYTSVSQ